MDVDEDYDTEQSDYGDIPIIGMFLRLNYLIQYTIRYMYLKWYTHTRIFAILNT